LWEFAFTAALDSLIGYMANIDITTDNVDDTNTMILSIVNSLNKTNPKPKTKNNKTKNNKNNKNSSNEQTQNWSQLFNDKHLNQRKQRISNTQIKIRVCTHK
jgi:hypothetical protein